jgi:hypothetical protein
MSAMQGIGPNWSIEIFSFTRPLAWRRKDMSAMSRGGNNYQGAKAMSEKEPAIEEMDHWLDLQEKSYRHPLNAGLRSSMPDFIKRYLEIIQSIRALISHPPTPIVTREQVDELVDDLCGRLIRSDIREIIMKFLADLGLVVEEKKS